MSQEPDVQNINQTRLEKHSFLVTLILLSVLFFFLLKPFWGAIFWACIIGLLFSPLYQRFLRMGKPKPNMSALATLLVCLIICIAPTLFVLGSFFREGVNLYQMLRSGELDLGTRIEQIQSAFPALQDLLNRLNLDVASLQGQLSDAALGATGYIAQNAFVLGQGTLGFFISLALMLYVAFFMLRDGDQLVELLIRALPLGDEREHMIFAKFAEVVRATVKGNLLVAMVQGSLGGLIFFVLGIDGAFLWGVVMTLLSLIPVVGAGLIWAPVAIYLFSVGNWTDGLILTAFGAGVISVIDNLLRPLLVGRDTKLPDYIVLLSTLGGFALFGINGFVLGPLVAALFIAFWQIFMREFNSPSQEEPRQDNASK